jgi:SAM-dependent methyltransferase
MIGRVTSGVSAALRMEFGEIDIYLFDQLLRGRFDRRRRLLDAGCGEGRNLPYFLRHGFDVRAIDADPSAIGSVRRLAASLNPSLPLEQIQQGSLGSLPWEDSATDAVICSAVLHFAHDERDFATMVAEMWRVLAPGRSLLRASGDEHRPRASSRIIDRSRAPARRLGALCRGRADAVDLDLDARRNARRSDQDDERSGHAVHDDLGDGEEILTSTHRPERLAVIQSRSVFAGTRCRRTGDRGPLPGACSDPAEDRRERDRPHTAGGPAPGCPSPSS